MLSDLSIQQIRELKQPIYLLIHPNLVHRVEDGYFNFNLSNDSTPADLPYKVNDILDASLREPTQVVMSNQIISGIRIAIGHEALLNELRDKNLPYAWIVPDVCPDLGIVVENTERWTKALTARIIDTEVNRTYAKSLLESLETERSDRVNEDMTVTYTVTDETDTIQVVEDILSNLPDRLMDQKRFMLSSKTDIYIPTLYRTGKLSQGSVIGRSVIQAYTVSSAGEDAHYQYLTILSNGAYYLIDFGEEMDHAFSTAMIIALLARLDEMYRIVSGAADKRTNWQTHMILFGLRYTVVGHGEDFNGIEFTDEIPDDVTINGLRLIREN